MSTKASIDMSPAERVAFLKAGDVAIVCAPTASGGLVARVAAYRAEGEDLVIDLSGAAAALPQVPGAVALVDAYPTYDQIKGVMLRGALEQGPAAGTVRLRTERASGFDFAKIPKAPGS